MLAFELRSILVRSLARSRPVSTSRPLSTSTPSLRPLTILGLESSADDTCASIVTSDRRILSNVVLRQHGIHEDFGGIHPLCELLRLSALLAREEGTRRGRRKLMHVA